MSSSNDSGNATSNSRLISTTGGDQQANTQLAATRATRNSSVSPVGASANNYSFASHAGDWFDQADSESVGAEAYKAALRIEGNDANGLSLYVHLPFCPSRCLTCDHATTVSHDHRQIDRYLDALETEVALVAEGLASRRRLQQLHLGGGTPNYLTEVQLIRLVDMLDKHFVIDSDTETSLEANAHRASYAQLSLLHGLGFRNLHLEVRDLDKAVQEATGRHQSFPVVRDVIESARQLGFERVSTDLVYGLPQQSLTSMRNTVEQLISLSPDRISCYRYHRRPETFGHQHALDEGLMPSLADKVAIFSRIVDGLCGAGYEWVGLDCFTRADDDIVKAQQSGTLHRNRIGYTTQQGRDLIGLGSSSSSELSSIHVRNHAGIEAWTRSLEGGQLPIEAGQQLTAEARARRRALTDLMCNLRVNRTEIAANDSAGDAALKSLVESGMVIEEGEHLHVTETGRLKLHQLWGDASPSFRWGKQAS
ncbi:MAG: oxygen-independent coproporphyrinogen III oxidase [Congregibacter sp.]